MSLLKALGLPPAKNVPIAMAPAGAPSAVGATKSVASAKPAPTRQAVTVEEDGGSTWDNREVSEDEAADWMKKGGGATAPAQTGPKGGGPTTLAETEPKGGGPTAPADAAPKRPDNIVVPVSLSIPIGKGNKYITIDKIKIEGELKLSAPGESGTTQSTTGVEVPLDKKKPVPVKKFEVDLAKLRELLLGDVRQSSQPSDWTIEEKLECKLSTEEANVSLGVKVTNRWYEGSVKFIAVAKSKGKDMEFANFNISPVGAKFDKRQVQLGGTTVLVSGKITVTISLKPNWKAICVDVASKVGRPVLSALTSVATMEVAVIAGFASIAAAQLFVFVKSVGDLTDIKVWKKKAENGWQSFMSGFCSAYGVTWPDGGVATLRQAGINAGKQKMLADLKVAREKMGAKADKFTDDEYIAYAKEQAGRDPNAFALLVEKMFRQKIMQGFLKAYADEHGDDYQFDSNYRTLQTLI